MLSIRPSRLLQLAEPRRIAYRLLETQSVQSKLGFEEVLRLSIESLALTFCVEGLIKGICNILLFSKVYDGNKNPFNLRATYICLID